ncbi:hypothetical protein HNR39_001177 [Glaciimonas immobilis]|uniref:Uncharacterized protein n=1 Tax=Glaciimonas immobilis TaxID=728004 RepID=A0A840RRZ4_9BURK|nr:hypothetical protein [Glaciimonas immobilis]
MLAVKFKHHFTLEEAIPRFLSNAPHPVGLTAPWDWQTMPIRSTLRR